MSKKNKSHVKRDVYVIIPVLNEESSIGFVIDDIPKEIAKEIIVINNGSSDNTGQVARDRGVTVLVEKTLGYGRAMMRGVNHLRASDKDILVFMDGDYSDHPDEIPRLIAPILEQDFDLVIGSRMLGEREIGALPLHAQFGNWLSTRLISLFWRSEFTDLGPFRAITFGKLRELHLTEPTFGWTVEMQINAVKKELKYCEVPVSYRRRIGQSKITGTVSGSFRAGIGILRTIFKGHLTK